jgi:hypothetical protein
VTRVERHNHSEVRTARAPAKSSSPLAIAHVGESGTDDDRDRRIAMAIWLERNDPRLYRRLRDARRNIAHREIVREDRIDLNQYPLHQDLLNQEPPRDFLAETARYDIVVLHNLWNYPGLSSLPDTGPTACSPLHSPEAWQRRLKATAARYIFFFGPHFDPGILPGFRSYSVPSQLRLCVLANSRRKFADSRALQPIGFSDMTAARLHSLEELRRNAVLDLSFNTLHKRDFERIGAMPHLADLSLVRTNVHDADLAALVSSRCIRKLNLDETGVSDEGIAHIVQLTGLQCLSLNHTRVTDQALGRLRSLEQLEWLSLVDTAISDAGLRYLPQIPSLRYLSVVQSKITIAGLRSMKRSLPQCWIDSELVEYPSQSSRIA